MSLPGCKADLDVVEGAGVTDSEEVSCKFMVDCNGVSREREAYVRRRGKADLDVVEGAGGTDSAEVSCKFTVDCDGVSRERKAYVRRRGMSNANSTINEILSG